MNVEDVKVVKVDNDLYSVENLSQNGKTLVDLLNDWRRKEANAQSELAMVRAAIRDLTNELIVLIRSEQNNKQELAEEESTDNEYRAEESIPE